MKSLSSLSALACADAAGCPPRELRRGGPKGLRSGEGLPRTAAECTRVLEQRTAGNPPPSRQIPRRPHQWRERVPALGVGAALAIASHTAGAFPGAYVGKSAGQRVAHSAHVVVMKHGDATVVTTMVDYDGPTDAPFAIVAPVPADVTPERVVALKREPVDRIEKLTAPRFHEFWEMDPCEPGPAQQEWERDLTASSGTDFLGGGSPKPQAGKVAKELSLSTDTDFRPKEYAVSIIGAGVASELKRRGYVDFDRVATDAEAYVQQGMKIMIAEVDPKTLEMIGATRAVLAPIRFWTDQPYTKLPSRMGLANLAKAQELLVYVLDPKQRWEAKGYANAFAPTNLEVSFEVKERMGEFWAGLHDRFLAKYPRTFLTEYSWPTEGCGQPCQNEALLLSELLNLGGDVFEAKLPKDVREPKPPEPTEEEKKAAKAELANLPAPDRPKREKVMKEERATIARVKALVERQRYVLTRLHYRYDAAGLPADPELAPAAGNVAGGAGLPKGEKGEISVEVKPAEQARYQARMNHLHPWKGMQQCDNPERWRWGKPPRTYRGLRKIWVAEDLARKNRTQIDPAKHVHTPIPALDLAAVPKASDAAAAASASAAPSASATSEGARSSCTMSTPRPGSGALATALTLLGLAGLARRRR